MSKYGELADRLEYRRSLGLPDSAMLPNCAAALRALEAERLAADDLRAENSMLLDKLAHLEAERDRFLEALTMLAEGSTPWMDSVGDAKEPWQVMAEYARQVLAGRSEL